MPLLLHPADHQQFDLFRALPGDMAPRDTQDLIPGRSSACRNLGG
jgi:plasmid replication initiation protein